MGERDEGDRNSIKEATGIQKQQTAHHSMKGQTAGYILTPRNVMLFSVHNGNAKIYKRGLNLLSEANRFYDYFTNYSILKSLFSLFLN